jgi:hypothetical protein
MPDPGLSRASEDAGSLAPPPPRAIGPYVGGAACRFVASRWPWRLGLLAGPGTGIPSRCPACSPSVRGVHVEAQVIPDCTNRPRFPPCRARMLLSGTLIGRSRVSAEPHARVCAQMHAATPAAAPSHAPCARCVPTFTFCKLRFTCCMLRAVYVCRLRGARRGRGVRPPSEFTRARARMRAGAHALSGMH